MRKIQIMTDSASDISAQEEQSYGISVIPFPITIGAHTYLSRVELTNEGFYELLSRFDEIPTTSQITPFQFQQIYLRAAEAGVTDLILVLINSQASATYDNSVSAIGSFFEENPQYQGRFHIYSLDGMGYHAMYGGPVVRAAQMRDAGATAEEIVAYLRGTLPRQQAYFGIYDLKYAAKSGRIPSAAAFLGTKLNLKPIMKIYDRAITTAAKCRGEHKLVERLAELTVADMEPGTPYLLGYGSDPDALESLHSLLVARLGYEPEAVHQIGAAIAANSGPRVVGALFTRRAGI